MNKNQILLRFQSEYNAPEIETFDEFLTLVSLNKGVRNWYSKVKMEISVYDEIPESFKRAGVTPELWKKLEYQREKVKNANRIYSNSVNEASKVLIKSMQEADDLRNKSLSSVDMIIKLLGYTANELPIHYQLQLSKIRDSEQRRQKTKEFIDIEVEGFVKACLENKDLPYDPF